MGKQYRLVAFVGVAVSILYLASTFSLPKSEMGDPIGPAGFPILLGIALLSVSLGMLLVGRRSREVNNLLPNAAVVEADASAQKLGGPLGRYRLLLTVLGWLAFYAFTFETIGYLLSTSVTALGMLRVARRGSWLVDVAIAIGFSLGTQGIFSFLMYGGFPQGWLAPLMSN